MGMGQGWRFANLVMHSPQPGLDARWRTLQRFCHNFGGLKGANEIRGDNVQASLAGQGALQLFGSLVNILGERSKGEKRAGLRVSRI